MIKKISVITLAVSSAILLSTSVFAATIKPSGVYLEGNVGYAKVNEKVENADSDKNTGFGWNINGGYKINPNFAVEAGYTSFPDETVKLVFPEGFTGKIKGTNYAIDIAVKGIVPFSSDFSFFGKLGVAQVHQNFKGTISNGAITRSLPSVDGEGTAAYLGLGVGYAITQNVEVLAQASATSKVKDKVPAMYLGSVGVAYTF